MVGKKIQIWYEDKVYLGSSKHQISALQISSSDIHSLSLNSCNFSLKDKHFQNGMLVEELKFIFQLNFSLFRRTNLHS